MPEVKRTEKAEPKKTTSKKEVLYDDPQPGSVKDEKTGKYKYVTKSD